MSELTQLIDRLYAEGIPQLTDDTLSSAVHQITPDAGVDVQRLLVILQEMGGLLHQEDQPDLTVPPPSGEALMHIVKHWESMQRSYYGTSVKIEGLDQDIITMQPWGDFDVMKVEELQRRGCHLGFWQISSLAWAQQGSGSWVDDYHVLQVSQDADNVWFVTITPVGITPLVPTEAQEVKVCPSPVSTLIMLQTRYKDSLKRLETLMGDYALCHYGEVYIALQQLLPDGTTLPELSSLRPSWQQKLHALSRMIKRR